MQSSLIVWNYLLLASIFAFTQLLGILLYFRLRWTPRWVAATASALVPAVLFVLLAPILLFAGIREDAVCGMPALAALFFLFAGTIIQLVVGIFTQLALSARRRRRVRS